MLVIFLLAASAIVAQTPGAGRLAFENRCAKCHGADGNGGEMGPNITGRISQRDDQQLGVLIRQGLPGQGMPPTQVPDAEMTDLVRFLRSIQRRAPQPLVRLQVQTTDGKTLDGVVLGEGFTDLQLRSDDQKIHLLRRVGDRYREAQPGTDWPTYDGQPQGNRFTKLTEINKNNVNRLSPKWIFPIPRAGLLQETPVVAGGIMYVTLANECYALDAGTGRRIWHYQRPRSQEKVIDQNGTNRGAGVAGDRVFMETDNAHMIALNRFTGELLWDTEMADWRQNYFGTSAPLPIANGLVVGGVAGGESGANGFVVAFDQTTGKEAWRFWTVPKPGEPGSETWKGKDIEHGGAPTWFTGAYDPDLDIVYWPAGNPSKEYNGIDRGGDNLYSDCVLALDGKTSR